MISTFYFTWAELHVSNIKVKCKNISSVVHNPKIIKIIIYC